MYSNFGFWSNFAHLYVAQTDGARGADGTAAAHAASVAADYYYIWHTSYVVEKGGAKEET